MQFPLFRESVLYFRENAKWQGSRKCNASAGSAKPELIDLKQAILYPFRSSSRSTTHMT